MTIPALQQMKRDARKIVAVVVYDYQMAQIVDRAGVDLVSVGDSVGMNMWARDGEGDVSLDEMMLACRAVRRGVKRALLSCDVPGGLNDVVGAARALATSGADLVKVEADARTVRTIVHDGIAVWAQLGNEAGDFVRQAKLLEEAGASLLDFRHSGPVAGPAVTNAVSIPVIGGLGGGPWLDGRVRAVVNAIGYAAAALDDTADRYANVARVALDAVTAYADDVRAGRQVRGK